MTQRLKLSLTRPLAGLRSHRSPVEGAAGPGGAERWIFDMRQRAQTEMQRHEAFATCLEGIARAVESMTTAVDGRLEEIAALSTELGLALAREMLGAALEKGIADPTLTVERCLKESVAGPNEDVAVFLAPDDLGEVLARMESHPDLRDHLARASFAADPGLDRGSVRIETASGQLLYDPAEVLQRICDEVRREMAG